MPFDFKNLFILDLANNHQGDLDHAENIIRQLGSVVEKHGIRAALKFQFRQLETFIHPDFLERTDVPHIPRFVSTRLSIEDYSRLIIAARDANLLTMCTPFDEASVDIIESLDIDVLKVASCSVTDTPLLERIAASKMPTIASTGGASIEQIDDMVFLFKERNVDFALHHCVSVYPTPIHKMELNQIGVLATRYPDIDIGWSTHEDPNDTTIIQLAAAKGAVLFERHVGLETGQHKLNAYSSNPEQVDAWLAAFANAKLALGSKNRSPSSTEEIQSLNDLKRGVFLREDMKSGTALTRNDVFFAMPLTPGALEAGDWTDGITLDTDLRAKESIPKNLASSEKSQKARLDAIVRQVKGMLNDAKIKLNQDSAVEISHHYGLERFREFGAVIIDVINREYCKKLICQLPRQKHPYHFHKRKEETFQILYGDLEVEKDGEPFMLTEGDLFLVEPNHWHKFSTMKGVIFEEISTTHYNDDSFYEDETIQNLPREDRKTKIVLT